VNVAPSDNEKCLDTIIRLQTVELRESVEYRDARHQVKRAVIPLR
jgi:hypothetical protein